MKKLCIDIGNTMTDIGIIDTKSFSCLAMRKLPTSMLIERIDNTLADLPADTTRSLDVTVCSVVPLVEKTLLHILREQPFVRKVSTFATNGHFPFAIHYEDPIVLGKDRIANALYAHFRYPRKCVIIIDAGTTITVDLLDPAKGFVGGMIMPGLNMQLQSLHNGTAALPSVSKFQDFNYPGFSTLSCMQLGVLYSCSGGVQKVVQWCREHYGQDFCAVACGGNWPQIQPLVNEDITYEAGLTLIGISLFDYQL
ncbi:MAG: type III pantothenate kinase [Chitinispirillaceae bacterium]